jgi:hypothetical protein
MPRAATAAARAAESPDDYAPRYARSAPVKHTRAGSSRPSATRNERRPVRHDGFAPRAPRRVSGPAARAVVAPRPTTRPFAPSPRPAPARPVRRPAPQRSVAPGGVLARPLLAIKALPDNRLLDRIVRGRAWIAILGVLLVAIVGTQVEVLKLGTDVGRSTALAAQLGARNALLRAQETNMSNPSRIMRLAEQLGMREVGPTNITYLPAGGPGVVGRAIADIAPPTLGAFSGSLTEQVGAGATTVTNNPLDSTTTSTTTSTNTGDTTPSAGDTTPSTGGTTNSATDPTAGGAGAGTTAGGGSSPTNGASAPGTSTGGAGI